MAKDFEACRREMVARQIRARGVSHPGVLAAMSKVPRHLFVPAASQGQAYDDLPLSIGKGQTISQPYMVALMSECLSPGAGHRVLEVGTGSGYQTAVLAEMVQWVYSVERLAELARQADSRLASLGYANISLQEGDGSRGLPEEAPFDGILVTAGSPEVPTPLVDQLKAGGTLVIPVGDAYHQTLIKVFRDTGGGVHRERVAGCVFVPLIGTYGWSENQVLKGF